MIDNKKKKYIGEMDEEGNPLGFGEVQHYTETSNGRALNIDSYGTWRNNTLHGICKSKRIIFIMNPRSSIQLERYGL